MVEDYYRGFIPVNGAEILEIVFLSQNEDDSVVSVSATWVHLNRGKILETLHKLQVLCKPGVKTNENYLETPN